MVDDYVVDINADGWREEVLDSELPVVVEFWHDRCSWCIRLAPIYGELSGEYRGRLRFVRMNVLESGENTHLAIHQGVTGTPTIKFFCGCRGVGEIIGFRSKRTLREDIDKILSIHRECLERSTPLPSE